MPKSASPRQAAQHAGTDTKAAFARRVGITAGRVSQLIAEGLPVLPDGRIDVAEGTAWLEANLDPSRRAAAKPPAVRHATDSPSRGLVAAKAEHERLKVELARLELAKARGEVVEVEEVRRTVHGHAKALRDAVMGFSMRAAPTLAAKLGADPGAVHRVLDAEVRALLAELAEAPEPEFCR